MIDGVPAGWGVSELDAVMRVLVACDTAHKQMRAAGTFVIST